MGVSYPPSLAIAAIIALAAQVVWIGVRVISAANIKKYATFIGVDHNLGYGNERSWLHN